MSCGGCFTGCVDVTSDQCIKYTGEDVPLLGISNGDTLLSVIDAITSFLSRKSDSFRMYSVMIPYAAMPYYGDLNYFSVTGAGLTGTMWEKVYLCNGNNGTPDLADYHIMYIPS